MITMTEITKMAVNKPNAKNAASVLKALDTYGPQIGLDRPHRLAHFFAQVMHESADFRYDQEIWGPTPAQKRYDTRADLGNTPAKDGDGEKYKGRGPIQLTGKDNVRRFTAWAKKIDPAAPDFVKNPELINTDPWEGLSALWYWDEGNPDRKSLNRYADQNNIEMVTKRVNGGLNGYADRLNRYGRCALVLLGYGTSKAEIVRFQREHPEAGAADGAIGQATRMALHTALSGVNPYEKTVEVEVAVPVPDPVVPDAVDEQIKKKTNIMQWLLGLFGSGGAAVSALVGADWMTVLAVFGGAAGLMLLVLLLRRQLIGAIGDIRDAIGGDA